MRGIPGRGSAAVVAVVMLALLALSTPAALAAQLTMATVRGEVADSGRPISGAHVEARSRETGAARGTTTDAAGRYQLLGLSPGSYDVAARALGYRPQRLTVELVLDTQLELDFRLTSGAIELDTMIVTAARQSVERLNVSTVISEKEIERLPLDSRDVLALASVAPGIRSFALKGGRAIPAAGAATAARFVNLYVDGDEWKGFATGALVGQPQSGSLIPQEAIREYRVVLNPYDAEYTRGASWVMSAVTHQGGNRVEGSIFGYLQNRQLVARGSFQQGNPSYQRSQIGGNIRGPIVHGRLFYSLSYEGQLTDNVIDVVPGRPPDTPGIWDRYAGSFPSPTDNQMGMLRFTGLAARHTVDATWLTRHLSSEGNFGGRNGTAVLSYEAGARSSYRINSVQVKDRYVAARWLNELSVHLLDNSTSDVPLRPGVAMRYVSVQTGRPGFPQIGTGRQVGIAEKGLLPLHGATGEHLLKAGVEALRVTGGSYIPNSRDGLFTFATDTSTLPSRGQIGLGFLNPDSDVDARANTDGWAVGGYLQDQWRPIPSLTLMLGLRYDAELNTLNQRQSAPWAADTVLQRVLGDWYLNTGDRVNDLDNVAPRVALSWDVSGHGRTSIRAGYGVMYDRVPVSGAFVEKLSWTWRVYSLTNPGTTDPATLRDSVRKNSTAAPGLTLLPDRMETPSTRQWSAGASHRLSRRLTISADYLDQHMRNLPVTVRVNAPNTANQRLITNRYGDIVLWGSFGDATYRALLTSVSFDGDVTHCRAAYTLASARSEFGGLTSNGAFTTTDFVDSSLYRMHPSDGDERHRVVLSGLTDAPFGIQLSTIALAASPRPFYVTAGTDVNRNGTVEDDWPNGTHTRRRAGWTHWYRTIDLRVGKTFTLPHGEMIVSTDVFNVANWANHSDYQPNQKLLGFAEPAGDYARRQAQLGVRYRF